MLKVVRSNPEPAMNFHTTHIPGLLIFDPMVFADERGYFFESYRTEVFAEQGIREDFVQDNESKSDRGVLRGLHYQINPFAMAKLVRVVAGEVLDVAVDIRKGSPTYLQHHTQILSAENKKQMYIPAGFAHGYVVLSDSSIFIYKCSNYYQKEYDTGIFYNDPDLNIDWRLPKDELIISEKDKNLPLWKDAKNNFVF